MAKLIMTDTKKIKKILRLLNRVHGKPERFKNEAPMDVLIRTILSQNTSDTNSDKAFAVLKANFKSWDALLKSNTKMISRLIRSAGLSNIKAKRLKDALSEIRRREGRIGLSRLKNFEIDVSLNYLRSLNGVGPKTAACVLLFGFGMPVMPVDTHIFRVTKRLGLIEKDIKVEEAHNVLSRKVPADLIYDFHLGIIEHGRRTCRAQNPRCGICVLYGLCMFKKKEYYRKKGEKS